MKNKLLMVFLAVLVLAGMGACKKERQAAEARSPEKVTETAIEEKKVEEKKSKNPFEGTYWMSSRPSMSKGIVYSGLVLGKDGNGAYYDTDTNDNREVKYVLYNGVWYIGQVGKEAENMYKMMGIDINKAKMEDMVKATIFSELKLDGENLTYVYKLQKTNEQEFKSTFAKFIK